VWFRRQHLQLRKHCDELPIAERFCAMSTVEELTALINAKGEEIRVLKAEKASKEALTPHINDLLALKERFQILANIS
jgi:hypothetical protein